MEEKAPPKYASADVKLMVMMIEVRTEIFHANAVDDNRTCTKTDSVVDGSVC